MGSSGSRALRSWRVASHLPKLPLLMLQPSSNMRTLVDLIGMCVLAYDMLTTPLILAWDLEVFAMCEVILSTLFPNWTPVPRARPPARSTTSSHREVQEMVWSSLPNYCVDEINVFGL